MPDFGNFGRDEYKSKKRGGYRSVEDTPAMREYREYERQRKAAAAARRKAAALPPESEERKAA